MSHIPERMCIGCRIRRQKSELIRVVMTDSGIVLDEKQNILARGAYICKNGQCILMAKKKKALSRQFKQNVPDSVYEMLLEEVSDE